MADAREREQPRTVPGPGHTAQNAHFGIASTLTEPAGTAAHSGGYRVLSG